MGLIKSFTNLDPRTRLYVGIGVIAWGLIGINLSNLAEKKLGYQADDIDRARLHEGLPSSKDSTPATNAVSTPKDGLR